MLIGSGKGGSMSIFIGSVPSQGIPEIDLHHLSEQCVCTPTGRTNASLGLCPKTRKEK